MTTFSLGVMRKFHLEYGDTHVRIILQSEEVIYFNISIFSLFMLVSFEDR